MLRLAEQILFLMAYGRKYFPELGELLNKPYQYSLFLPKNSRAVRRALSRLKRRGEVAVQGRRERAHYRVTREGMVRLLDLRPYLAGAKWDRKWRVVVFDIPERYRGMRAVLRRFLTSVGAGAWQRSLWVTPFAMSREIRAFIEASRLGDMSTLRLRSADVSRSAESNSASLEMAFLLEIEKIYGLESKRLADKVWKLAGLSQRYEAFALECERATPKAAHLGGQSRQNFAGSDLGGQAHGVTMQQQRAFAKLVFGDPLLPEELLPEGFARGKAMRAYRDLLGRSELTL